MRVDIYPEGTVTALINTGLVTSRTSDVLKERLEQKEVVQPSFFDKETFLILRAVCNRLVPQYNPEKAVDLAGCLDTTLREGKGNGWRYDTMPPDYDAYVSGLNAINETSERMFGAAFKFIDEAAQDQVLSSIQNNTAEGKTWESIPASLFFEELLAALVELYYCHPYAKEEIGEVAMADARGWQRIGLNELEAHEPLALKK